MLRKLQQARLFWPTLAALAGLAVLIGLGTWQMERKRWKEDLLAKIAARVHAEPIPLACSKGPCDVLVKGDPEYLHVAYTGRFRHDKERYLYAPAPTGPGWHVYTPLELDPANIVWVNRGFVPDDRKDPTTRLPGQVAGEVEVRGLLRLPAAKGVFTPENDPARNLWYWPDLPAMTASAFPDPSRRPSTLVVSLDADTQPEPPGGLPRGGVTRLDLPNRHLEYALTWYGLAATLVGVYLAFAISRLGAVS